jgi:ethanolamine ammonia-lyase large subunit
MKDRWAREELLKQSECLEKLIELNKHQEEEIKQLKISVSNILTFLKKAGIVYFMGTPNSDKFFPEINQYYFQLGNIRELLSEKASKDTLVTTMDILNAVIEYLNVKIIRRDASTILVPKEVKGK